MSNDEIPAVRLYDFIIHSIVNGPKEHNGVVKWFVSMILYWRTYAILVAMLIGFYLVSIGPIYVEWPPRLWGFLVGILTTNLAIVVGE